MKIGELRESMSRAGMEVLDQKESARYNSKVHGFLDIDNASVSIGVQSWTKDKAMVEIVATSSGNVGKCLMGNYPDADCVLQKLISSGKVTTGRIISNKFSLSNLGCGSDLEKSFASLEEDLFVTISVQEKDIAVQYVDAKDLVKKILTKAGEVVAHSDAGYDVVSEKLQT